MKTILEKIVLLVIVVFITACGGLKGFEPESNDETVSKKYLVSYSNFGAAYDYLGGFDLVGNIETVLKMRAVSSQFTYESLSYQISKATQTPIPSNGELHVIGAYSGNITVDIQRTIAPIVLVFSSYENMNWNLKLAPGVQIAKILYCSYKECYGDRTKAFMSTFLGVDSGFLQRMSYGQVPYFYDLNSLAAAQAKIGAINSTGISKVTSQHVATSGAIVIK